MRSGAKIETITDFALSGEMGLKFERYYNSHFMCVDGAPCIGAGAWTTNLDYHLDPPFCEYGPDVRRKICYAGLFIRPDGSRLYFRGGVSYSTPGRDQPTGTATLTENADGTYTLHDEDAHVLTFSSQGALLSVKDSLGIGWTLTRPDGNTVVVTHTNGQSFRLSVVGGSTVYGTPKQIRVTDPAGNIYLYDSTTSAYEGGATPVSHLGNLDKVTLPGSPSTVVAYKYYPDDQTAGQYMMLKEVDYNGVAHDITTYDSAGRATMTSLADGSERTSIVYGSNATGPTATVTSPLNHVSVYQYDSAGNLVSVTGNAATNCPATYASMSYDANGFLTSSTDNNGTETQYTYDANGLLQQKIEAAGTSVQRKTDYVWDTAPGTDRLLSVTVEGWSKTVYTYDAQNRMASEAVTNLSSRGTANETLTTSYVRTLYSNGLVHTLTVTHPSASGSNKDVYVFDTLGRLSSVANALGQTTTYSNYNALGQPGKVVGPNGDETDYTYDARGRVVTKKTHPNGGTATWSFTYDGFGLPASQTDPDGKITMWSRDATTARVMVIGRTEKDGDSTESLSYNANGDVTDDVIQRGSDVGLSTHTSYDALGRVYQKTGNHGQKVTYGYDGNGNVVSVTDAVGHIASYQYDALNRVTKVIESGGATLGAPKLTVPADSTTGSYSVSWSSIGSATRYILEERHNSGSWSSVYSGSGTSTALAGRSNGTWSYRVQSCNGGGCGGWSTNRSVTVALPPPTPASITVPATSSGSLTVSWPSTATATSYLLHQSISGAAYTEAYSGAATSKTLSASVSGSYKYAVKACNASGCSGWRYSSTVAVTIPPGSAPSLSVPSSSSTGSYTVSWGAVSGASSYTLQEQVNSGSWSTSYSGSSRSKAYSGKSNGAAYGYRVRACNAGGCSAWSATKTIHVATIPATPGGLSATVYATFEPDLRRTFYELDATWSAVTGASSYELYYCPHGASCATQSVSSPPSFVTVHGAVDSAKVRACNTSGCSAWSATVVPGLVHE